MGRWYGLLDKGVNPHAADHVQRPARLGYMGTVATAGDIAFAKRSARFLPVQQNFPCLPQLPSTAHQ